jgi:hypothetical protein
MKKLRSFEIDAIVNCVYGKLEEKRKSEIKWKSEYDEVNKIVREKGLEINKLIEEFYLLRSNYKHVLDKDVVKMNEWNWEILFDMSGVGKYNENYDFISKNKGNFISYDVKNKIRNEIIMSNLRDEEVDSLVDKLVEKFK